MALGMFLMFMITSVVLKKSLRRMPNSLIAIPTSGSVLYGSASSR